MENQTSVCLRAGRLPRLPLRSDSLLLDGYPDNASNCEENGSSPGGKFPDLNNNTCTGRVRGVETFPMCARFRFVRAYSATKGHYLSQTKVRVRCSDGA
ncbi:hypothetical protein DPMN_131811 [Dreissena polymorpha]|uniref:Uncharacterized protein n=1 Tax=Dreissena polymorpha TaxID=45954 RepID=A0A9D4FUP8_DREPO|nr:hypothetical protein DPMN_131811 [Dreissena polymorpha]